MGYDYGLLIDFCVRIFDIQAQWRIVDIYLNLGRIASIIWNNPDMNIKQPQWVHAVALIYVEFNQML
jgi:hypothetical protein